MERIPLPGIEWSIADLRSGALLLNGSGYVLFDVSDPATELIGYFGDPPSTETARTFAGEVWAP